MRKTVIFIVLLLFIQISISYGHAPSAVTLDFNKETSMLEVKYEHSVRDVTQHYVIEAKVQLNGKEIIVQFLSSQEDLNGGSLVYKIIDAKPGDEILVQIRCNRAGSKSTSVKIQ
ncbi:hypothetical protein JW824_07410 [bacterium]|nr:hypothetical protein [bacterium]RQV95054.1 MAG: hypothetical protein EH221_06800 [bacterium]